MYTLANGNHSDTKISLLKPDFHSMATRIAQEMTFEDQRNTLLLSRMIWYGEVLFWMKQLKRYDCIMCNPEVSKLEFPSLDFLIDKCRQLQRLNVEPQILAHQILSHSDFYH